jgi:LCP family protein required for cell wall assembly
MSNNFLIIRQKNVPESDMPNEVPNHIDIPTGPAKRSTKRPPEKRLFHKPVTPVKAVIYALIVLGVVALVLLARFVYITVIDARAAFPATPVLTPVPTDAPQASSGQAAVTPAPTQTLSPEELLAQQVDPDFMQNRVNILLTGIDYAPEREGRNDFRTDTIMMFSVDFSSGKVDILSVPRDSYADIAYTDTKWKINGAYMSAGGVDGKGYECLMQTVSDTIGGIPVDYYVAVKMQAVKEIVDILGGVWYDVDYEINMNGRHLDKGYQLLDGQDVLDYCRARKGITSGTDIDRIDRQQRLLMEVFRQVKKANLITQMPQIYQTMKDEIDTNLTFEQIASLAFFALDLDPDTGLSRYALKGEYMEAYNASYYVLDHNVTVSIIKQIFDVDVTNSVDWTYSIKYVKNDVARTNLTASMVKLGDYLNLRRDTLSDDLINQTESLLTQAQDLLNSTEGNTDESATDELTDMTALLESMYTTLQSYVPPTPTPAPTEAPVETPAPDATT